MEIQLSNSEYGALMDIKGPPENVHSMIMTAGVSNKTWTLDGDEADFDDLLNLISEEIGEDFCPKKNVRPLLRVCKKVDPESLNWIGF